MFEQDWKAAEPNPALRDCDWETFLKKMRDFYKPTENTTLRNYEFHQLTQNHGETFRAFCNRIEKEGKTCHFCDCPGAINCNAEKLAIRDQIVIGTNNEKIREKALFEGWNLESVRQEGMNIESAATGKDTIANAQVNKVGSYSYKNLAKGNNKQDFRKKKKCFRCGEDFSMEHLRVCAGKNHKCKNCHKPGHLESVCKQVNEMESSESRNQQDRHDRHDDDQEASDTYRLNVWPVKTSKSTPKFVAGRKDETFKKRLVVNNRMAKLLCDTGAKVSVCGMKQAAEWGLLDRMTPSKIRIHPYKSQPIPIRGIATCAVSFKDRVIPVDFHILPGSCEPILSGSHALQLKIISFDDEEEPFNPILMVDAKNKEEGEFSYKIQDILTPFPHNFKGRGLLKGHQATYYENTDIKPVAVPARTPPYHLQASYNETSV